MAWLKSSFLFIKNYLLVNLLNPTNNKIPLYFILSIVSTEVFTVHL